MKLYYNGVACIDISPDDSSYLYKSIMGENTLNITFTLSENKTIPIGAYCDFLGERYTLMKPMGLKKNHTKSYSYTLALDGMQATLSKYKYKNPTDKSLKFSVTAKPQEHLQMLVDSLNQHDAIWVLGDCLDAVEGDVAYNHNSCMEALNAIAQAFNTEWEVEDTHDGKYKIHLKKVEYNKTDPLTLSYGKGKGFLSGLGRVTESANQIEVLYVQGGSQNIDASKYKSEFLLLPKSSIYAKRYLAYDGEKFYDQYSLTNLPPKELNCRLYVTDEKGTYITRADKELERGVEASLDCSHIYPKGGGTVKSFKFEHKNDPLAINCDFVGVDNVATGLDYHKLRANGDNVRIIFQEGMLTGKEFDANYNHASSTFKIVPQDMDGQRMPNTVFTPEVGQKYIVLGITMPEEYICNDTTRKGASWDMYREGVKYLYENEKPRYSYTGTLDGVWAKRSWGNIHHKIKLGGYIQFVDKELVDQESDDILIRMTGIKQSVNNPFSPELEFTNVVVSGGVSSMLKRIDANEVIAEDDRRKAFNFTKRRFNDAQETQALLKDSLLDFSTPANPISVHTMSTLVGDESLQFRFVEFVSQETTPIAGKASSVTIPRQAKHHIEYHKGDLEGTGSLKVPEGILQHLTLDVDSAQQSPLAYKYWKIAETTFNLEKGDKRHYLYARVNKTGNIPDISNPTGADNNFVFSEKAIKLESEEGYYHLLVGVLNSDTNDERSYVSLYGFSELLPGRLTTGRIVSSDGQTYFDLDSGTIGGKIVFEQSDNKYVTVIEGGKINTDCINTNDLVAKKIRTATSGRRIEINHDNSHAICMYSQMGPPGPPLVPAYELAAAPGVPGEPSGPPGVPGAPQGNNPTLIIDGNNITSLTDFVNPKDVPPSFTISELNYSKTYDRYNIKPGFPKANTEPQTFLLTSSLFTISSDASGSLITHLPKMEFEVEGRGEGTGSFCSCGWIEVGVYLDSTLLGEKRISFTGYESPQLIVIEESNRKLSVGLHKIWVSLEGHHDLRTRTGESSLDPNTYLPVHLGVRLKTVSSSVSFTLVDKLTQIFANGFGSRYDTKKHFCVINSSGAPLVNVRGEQSYLSTDGETGVVINDQGVFYSRNTKPGTSGINTVIKGAVPSLVYMGVVNASGTSAQKWAGYPGSQLRAQRLSAGQYQVTMDGLFANGNDYIVTVTPKGPGSLSIVNQAANTFNVCNNSAVDVGFTFFVYNVCGMLK